MYVYIVCIRCVHACVYMYVYALCMCVCCACVYDVRVHVYMCTLCVCTHVYAAHVCMTHKIILLPWLHTILLVSHPHDDLGRPVVTSHDVGCHHERLVGRPRQTKIKNLRNYKIRLIIIITSLKGTNEVKG